MPRVAGPDTSGAWLSPLDPDDPDPWTPGLMAWRERLYASARTVHRGPFQLVFGDGKTGREALIYPTPLEEASKAKRDMLWHRRGNVLAALEA